MNTKIIGVRDFRQNITDYVNKARKGDTRFVVANRSKPLFELKPFAKDAELEDLFKDILEAEQDIKKGRVYSQEEILAEFA